MIHSKPHWLRTKTLIFTDLSLAALIDSLSDSTIEAYSWVLLVLLLESPLSLGFYPQFPKQMKQTSAEWKKTFPFFLSLTFLSLRFSVLSTLRVWVLRKRWAAGRALCVCHGLWGNCSSCCSTRHWPSASRWWFERLRIWPSSQGSQELQVKTTLIPLSIHPFCWLEPIPATIERGTGYTQDSLPECRRTNTERQ